MTRTDIVKGMRTCFGSEFLDINQIMTYCGYKSRNSVTPILYGLRRFNKKYSIYDIADRIMENYNHR